MSKSNAGRKTKYHDDFPLLAQDYARQGMIDKEIAAKLGISVDTLYEYQKKYPEFSDALKEGKKPVDVAVENALLKRALGFEFEEVHVEFEPIYDKRGKKIDKGLPKKVKKIKKMYVPEIIAQFFWLKNRRPELWRDKHDVEHSGAITYEVSEDFIPDKIRPSKNDKSKKNRPKKTPKPKT